MRYQWDFSKIKWVSFRKGGRIKTIRYDGSTSWIAPEDRDEFKKQYDRYRRNHTEEFLEKFDS